MGDDREPSGEPSGDADEGATDDHDGCDGADGGGAGDGSPGAADEAPGDGGSDAVGDEPENGDAPGDDVGEDGATDAPGDRPSGDDAEGNETGDDDAAGDGGDGAEGDDGSGESEDGLPPGMSRRHRELYHELGGDPERLEGAIGDADGGEPETDDGTAEAESGTGTTDGGMAAGSGTATGAARGAGSDDPLLQGPEEDREMPLTAHIEEMLKRLAVVIAVAGVVSLLAFPFAERLINLLWYSILPGVPSDIARPRLYGILELTLTELKVASLAGLIVALPVLVYQTYQFMRPGLYPHERRYYLAAIPTSLVLALVGVSFAYFIVLPAVFTYFLYYSQDVAQIGFALGRTFDLILVLMGYLALVFQIPLFIMLAMMMGLVTRRWLADRRLLFWGSFLGISFLFSPDPTGMAPIIITLTMIALFEGTLLLTRWTGRE